MINPRYLVELTSCSRVPLIKIIVISIHTYILAVMEYIARVCGSTCKGCIAEVNPNVRFRLHQ